MSFPTYADRTAEDLAAEAAECIETCSLTGEQLRLYLAVFIAEVVVDLTPEATESMRRNLPLARRRYGRELDRT